MISKDRLKWTGDLSSLFDYAVQNSGGLEKATPSVIVRKLPAHISIDNVKSRLQKLRKDRSILIRNPSRPKVKRVSTLDRTELLNRHMQELSALF